MRVLRLSIVYPLFITAFWVPLVIGLNITACTSASLAAFTADPNLVTFYGQDGMPTTDLTQAWGISYDSCKVLCTVPEPFNWNFFSECMTSWLIPWLALAAQLPFETIDKRSNFMVMLLAIGSPALITYSLSLTILNARWINQKFRQVKENLDEEEYPQQAKALTAARSILIESQHIPIQIINGPDREISQLVVIAENSAWWTRLLDMVQKTKRGWTYSLYSQVSWVFVAQLLTIIDFFNTKSQSTTVGVGLAINCLWVWMIPITLGWVYVGTQTSAGSIKEALGNVTVPILGDRKNIRGRCVGIRDRSIYGDAAMLPGYRHDRDPSWRTYSTAGQREVDHERKGSLEIEIISSGSSGESRTLGSEKQSHAAIKYHPTDCGTFFGLSIAGCELEAGPIFNYARIWSHTNAVKHVAEAFHWSVVRQGHTALNRREWNEKNQSQNLDGSPEEMSAYTSKDWEDVPNLLIHGDAPWSAIINMFSAGLIAILMQWATTGSAIIIAYNTPVVGLGCNSGSYLLFGVLATLSWLTLVFSSYLSHRWSLLREGGNLQRNSMLGPTAVLTRLIGKTLAVLNAVWILLACIFQFTGTYDTCWCNSCALDVIRRPGWVALFASPAQIADQSSAAWIGGACLSIVVTLVITAWIFLSRGDEIFEENSQ